jgi:hypothetical protein
LLPTCKGNGSPKGRGIFKSAQLQQLLPSTSMTVSLTKAPPEKEGCQPKRIPRSAGPTTQTRKRSNPPTPRASSISPPTTHGPSGQPSTLQIRHASGGKGPPRPLRQPQATNPLPLHAWTRGRPSPRLRGVFILHGPHPRPTPLE